MMGAFMLVIAVLSFFWAVGYAKEYFDEHQGRFDNTSAGGGCIIAFGWVIGLISMASLSLIFGTVLVISVFGVVGFLFIFVLGLLI